jgi:putative zinc finger/helix-turn-helix YgiT family protein
MKHESAGPVRSRPFPWYCPNCREAAVYPERMLFKTEVKHDGRTYPLELPDLEVPRCRSCGQRVISHAVDDEVLRALRRHLRLLTPQQIRERREALGLSGTKLAERLGVAQETISRWETEALIQSRAMDNLLRVYFAFPEVRAALQGPGQDPNLGLTGGQDSQGRNEVVGNFAMGNRLLDTDVLVSGPEPLGGNYGPVIEELVRHCDTPREVAEIVSWAMDGNVHPPRGAKVTREWVRGYLTWGLRHNHLTRRGNPWIR